MNNVAMNIHVQVFVCSCLISLGYISRSGVAEICMEIIFRVNGLWEGGRQKEGCLETL